MKKVPLNAKVGAIIKYKITGGSGKVKIIRIGPYDSRVYDYQAPVSRRRRKMSNRFLNEMINQMNGLERAKLKAK
jgi:hypothetical protein